MNTKCLRCGKLCRTGTPDPKARAIREATERGLCPECISQYFIMSCGALMAAMRGYGPEVFTVPDIRKCFARVLAHTQLREDQVDWPRMVNNWDLPWPKGSAPKK